MKPEEIFSEKEYEIFKSLYKKESDKIKVQWPTYVDYLSIKREIAMNHSPIEVAKINDNDGAIGGGKKIRRFKKVKTFKNTILIAEFVNDVIIFNLFLKK